MAGGCGEVRRVKSATRYALLIRALVEWMASTAEKAKIPISGKYCVVAVPMRAPFQVSRAAWRAGRCPFRAVYIHSGFGERMVDCEGFGQSGSLLLHSLAGQTGLVLIRYR